MMSLSTAFTHVEVDRGYSTAGRAHVVLVHADDGNAMLISSARRGPVDKHNILGWAISQGEDAVVALLTNVPGIVVNAISARNDRIQAS